MKCLLRHIALVVALLCCLASPAQFYNADQAPRPLEFLSQLPPGETATTFAADIYRYRQMKQQRDSLRGSEIKLANNESTIMKTFYRNLVNYYVPSYGMAIDTSRYRITTVGLRRDTTWLSVSRTDGLYRFLYSSHVSSEYSMDSIPDSCQHIRPCVRLLEENFFMTYRAATHATNKTYATNYSFPSTYAVSGWTSGLVMTLTNPWSAQPLLSRTFQYGQDRMISGGMWQSDIDASRVIGSACLARLLASTQFRLQLKKMRQFMSDTLQTSLDVLPTCAELLDDEAMIDSLSRMIPDCPHSNDPVWSSDLAHYYSQLPLADSIGTSINLEETLPISNNTIAQLSLFERSDITPDDAPNIYHLLSLFNSCASKIIRKAQHRSHRRPPFDVFNTEPHSLEPLTELHQSSSYPSEHAATGWVTAVVMSMLDPDRQNELLKLGYDYGEHRVVFGTNWHSDVAAGRTLGNLALAYMISGSDFVQLLEDAQMEWDIIRDRLITEPEVITEDQSAEGDSTLYTIDGRRATPATKGVVVGKNKKIIVR